jgi:hypothetical protein
METISITYTIKFVISFARHYKWTSGNFLYNLKTGRIVKQTIKGGSIGYCIDGKFYTLKYLKTKFLKPKKEDCPF